MDQDDIPAYRVEQHTEGFRVVNDTGDVVMVCRDARSAGHNAQMLCRAYQRGFKAGYRKGKR